MANIKRTVRDIRANWRFLSTVVGAGLALGALFNLITIDPFDYPDFIEYTVGLMRTWTVLLGGVVLIVAGRTDWDE